jgi:hypothetical protein
LQPIWKSWIFVMPATTVTLRESGVHDGSVATNVYVPA